MPKAPVVIHQFGRPKKAKLLSGKWIDRPDEIYVPTHHRNYSVLDYDSHFVYRDGEHLGSTLMCTCGAAASVIGYEGYRKYASYQGSQVIACLHYTQYGSHADGSH